VEQELGRYEFAHLSFQEYLAASEVIKRSEESFLIDKVNDSWWGETIRLYAAQTDANNIIEAILANPTPTVNSLSLAFDCCREGLPVNRALNQQVEDKVIQGLESNDQEIVKLAAQVKLSRRLQSLMRFDETLEIGLSYVTKAEYWLYSSEKGIKELPGQKVKSSCYGDEF
jgi:hypothetical protein